MTVSPARRLWWSLEPVHDVVYFGPGVREAGLGLGLRGYWMTYFAFRAAPLGPVSADPVVAMFAGFHRDMVAKALPDAWSRTSAEACLGTRAEVASGSLRTIGIDSADCRSIVDLLAPVVRRADPTGRPIFAANAALPLSGDPVAALWQLATALREHRGDGHVGALVADEVSGLEAHLLQVAAGRIALDTIRAARGWPDQDWAEATQRLQARRLLSVAVTPVLTDEGRGLLTDIETRTDQAAWSGGLASLGESGVDRVVDTLRLTVAALRSSGMLPDLSPTGLPTPT